MGAGNQTQVFWKSMQCSELLSHLSSPSAFKHLLNYNHNYGYVRFFIPIYLFIYLLIIFQFTLHLKSLPSSGPLLTQSLLSHPLFSSLRGWCFPGYSPIMVLQVSARLVHPLPLKPDNAVRLGNGFHSQATTLGSTSSPVVREPTWGLSCTSAMYVPGVPYSSLCVFFVGSVSESSQRFRLVDSVGPSVGSHPPQGLQSFP